MREHEVAGHCVAMDLRKRGGEVALGLRGFGDVDVGVPLFGDIASIVAAKEVSGNAFIVTAVVEGRRVRASAARERNSGSRDERAHGAKRAHGANGAKTVEARGVVHAIAPSQTTFRRAVSENA